MPEIVSRSEWGAPAAAGGERLPLSHVRRVFVHYTGSAADFQADHANCARRVLGIYRYHTSPTPDDPTKPWADIAYSWIVCVHGVIFEGRGHGRRTAATGPCNHDSYAICFLGNDRDGRRDVTPAALGAIAWLIADLERRKGGRLAVHGHRDCMGTACPGDELYALIRSGAIRNPKEEDPMPSPEEIAEAVWKHPIAPSASFPAERNATQHLRGLSVKLGALTVDGTDPAAVADAITNALGPELAAAVVGELRRRLAN